MTPSNIKMTWTNMLNCLGFIETVPLLSSSFHECCVKFDVVRRCILQQVVGFYNSNYPSYFNDYHDKCSCFRFYVNI